MIIERSQFAAWLDPGTKPVTVAAMLAPYRGRLRVEAVSKAVSNARNEFPAPFTPIGPTSIRAEQPS